MATSSDLLLSILALDSYNRGYLPGMPGLASAAGTAIGGATILRTTDDAESQAASFYAVAYSWNGQTVISYRGTRFDGYFGPDETSVLNGWSMSLGFSATAQTDLAGRFYTTITGRDVFDATTPGNVILTGHSLGGGLAGYLAALTGTRATIFNNIAFGTSVVAAVASENYARGGGNLVDVLTGNLSGSGFVALPTGPSSIQQFVTSGEIGFGIRFASPFVSQPVFSGALAGLGVALPAANAAAIAASLIGAALDLSVRSESVLPSASFGLNSSNLHSQALMVMNIYADLNRHVDWLPAASAFGTAFFDENLATSAGFDPASQSGWYSSAGKLMSTIAYSAVEEGSPQDAKPFGDKAVRALFNDADQLGRYHEATAAAPVTVLAGADVEQALARIVVQYAGDRALAKSTAPEDAKGVIGWEQNSGLFQIDLDAARYTSTFGGLGTGEIVGATDLLDLLADRLAASVTGAAATALQEALNDWETGGAREATVLVTAVVESRSVDVAGTGLPESNGEPGGMIFLSGIGSDRIVGSQGADIIAGGNGDDRIRSAGGADILLGGKGDDILVADGYDASTSRGAVLIGGEGADRFVIDYAAGGTAANKTIYTISDADADDRLYLGQFFGDALTVPTSADELLIPLLGGTRDWNPFEFQGPQQGPDLFYASKPTAFDNYNANGDRGADGNKEWVFDLGGFNEGWAVQVSYQLTGPDLLIFLAPHNRFGFEPTSLGSFKFVPDVTAVIRVLDYDGSELGLTFYEQMSTYTIDFITNIVTPQEILDQIVADHIAVLSGTIGLFAGSASTISAAWTDDPVTSPDGATTTAPTVVPPPLEVLDNIPVILTDDPDVAQLTPPSDPGAITSPTLVDASGGVDTVTVAETGIGVSIDLGTGQTSIGYTLAAFENVIGTSAADTLTGSDGGNGIWGRDGDDVIGGGGGADRLYGEGGDDSISGGGGSDTIDGGDGSDVAVYDGVRTDYLVVREEDGTLRVTDLRGSSGDRDVLRGIETLEFAGVSFSEADLANRTPIGSGLAGALTSRDAEIRIAAQSLLAGFSDPDDDDLSVSAVGNAEFGTVALDGGDVVFTPGAGYTGLASFDYTVSDGAGGSRIVRVPVYVTDVSAAPVVSQPILLQSSPEDASWTFVVPAATFSDTDSSTLTLSARLADGGGLPAWLTFDPLTATFSGQPPTDFNGDIAIVVTASDGQNTADAAFTLRITPVNDAPDVAPSASLSLVEDAPATTVMIGATDVDGDALSYALASGSAPQLGTLTFDQATGSFTYTAAPDASGIDTFTIVVSDAAGAETSQTVNITLAAAPDAAVIGGTTAGTVTEDASLTASGTLSIVDPDQGEESFLPLTALTGTYGSLSLTSDGVWTYQLANASAAVQSLGAADSVTDAFTVAAFDGTEQIVSITIRGADEAGGGIAGSSGTDIINGTTGADLITAGGGFDVVRAGAGNDTIVGPLNDGNDAYDAGSGIDTLDLSAITASVTLSLGVSIGGVMIGAANSTQTGTDGLAGFENVISGSGNDTLLGNALGNELVGNAGNDRLLGLGGNDTLTGGPGNDAFYFGPGFGRDTIRDFTPGAGVTDVIELQLGASFNSFGEIMAAAAQVGSNTVITFSATNTLTLEGVLVTQLAPDDFRYF